METTAQTRICIEAPRASGGGLGYQRDPLVETRVKREAVSILITVFSNLPNDRTIFAVFSLLLGYEHYALFAAPASSQIAGI